jgi:hypothetical protein
MAFDPSSAKPVSAGFDPSTAVPVSPDMPDDATRVSPVEVLATKRENFGVPDAPKESLGTQLKGVVRSLAGGAMFNFNDELEAALRSGRVSGPEYEAIRDKIRDAQNRYQAKHPMVSGLANVGGALLTAAPALLIPGVGEAAVGAELAGPLARVAQAAGIGAVEGGVAGLGGSKDKFSLEGAGETAKGAIAGAVLAPVAAAAPGMAREGVGVLKNIFGKPSEEEATQKVFNVVAETLRRQGKTPAEIEAEITRLRNQGVPTNIGEQGAPGITAEVMRRPEGAPLAASTGVAQTEAGTRTGEQVTNLVTKGVDYDASREAIVNRMRANAKPAYAKAYEYGEVDDPFIKNIIDLPVMSTFWSDAMAAAERDASVIAAQTGKRPVNPLSDYLVPTGRKTSILGADGKPFEITEYKPNGDKVPNVEALDYLKRGMDEAIDRGYRGGGMSAKGASDFRLMRNALTDRLDTLVPNYAAARASFKGDAEIRDAFDMGMGEKLGRGEKALEKMRPAEVNAWTADASEAEKQAAFSGYGNFLYNKLATATNPAAFVSNPARMARLRSLASDPAEVDLLEAALKRETELFAQRGNALTGVSAAVKKAAQDDMATALDAGDADLIGAAFKSAKPGYFIGTALRLLGKAKYPPEVVAKLADVLGSGTPDEVANVVVGLTKATAAMAPRQAAQAVTRGAAAVAAGNVAAGHGVPGLVVEGVPSFEAAPSGETPADEGEGNLEPVSYTSGDGTSLGERNNNQGNVINGPFAEKQPGYDGVGEGGFAKFKTSEAGNAAQERLLATIYLSKGFNTPNKIVEKYSPREDPRNTPEAMTSYKKYIADQLGIGVNDPIPARMVAELAQAMRAFETGNT